MMESEQTAELAAALAKAQAAMKPAIINKINPHFKNRYADLAAVLDAVRKPLADNGLAVTQTTHLLETDKSPWFMLRTTLRHTSGQWLASEYPLPAGAKPQELGSALTYGRRYSLSAMLCIAADEDDDANTTNAASAGNGKTANQDEPRITPAQIQALSDAMDERGTDIGKFLQWAGVELLKDIPASEYEMRLAGIKKAGGGK